MSFSVIIILIIIGYLLYKRYKYVQRINKLPSPFPKPFFGIMGCPLCIYKYIVTHNPTDVGMLVIDVFPLLAMNSGICMMWLGPLPIVGINSPEAVKVVLSNSVNTEKGVLYKFLKPWLGTGLLTASREKYKKNRKLITPTFHFRILEQFVPIMNNTSKTLIEIMKEEAHKNNGVINNFQELMSSVALDIICETAMGERIDSLRHRESEYFKAAESMEHIFMYRVMRPWFYPDFIFRMFPKGKEMYRNVDFLHKYTNRVIESRMMEMENSTKAFETKKREPFIDTLIREHIRDPKSLSMTDIREEVDSVMFAGHSTTSWALTWTVFLLGLHPKIQSRLQQEIDSVYDSLEEKDELTLDVLKNKLPFTEAVIKEGLRLYSPAAAIGRTITTDIKIGEYVIPTGCQAIILPRLVHRDPSQWKDPERFIPERFLSDTLDVGENYNSIKHENCNTNRRHPYSYIPFSAGLRNCVGQRFALLEEKVIIANIFRHFNVTSLDKIDQVPHILSIVTQTNVPIRLRVEKRLK